MDWGNIGLLIIFGGLMVFMHRNGGGCCGGGSGDQAHKDHGGHRAEQTINTQQVRLAVEGMTCGHCVQKIEKVLLGINGVVSVDVSLETNSVKATFDPERTTAYELKEAIRNTGYGVQLR